VHFRKGGIVHNPKIRRDDQENTSYRTHECEKKGSVLKKKGEIITRSEQQVPKKRTGVGAVTE